MTDLRQTVSSAMKWSVAFARKRSICVRHFEVEVSILRTHGDLLESAREQRHRAVLGALRASCGAGFTAEGRAQSRIVHVNHGDQMIR